MKKTHKWMAAGIAIMAFGITLSLEAATTTPKATKITLATLDKKISNLESKLTNTGSASNGSIDEFLIIGEQNGKSDYIVSPLSCRNGVRIIARLQDTKPAEMSVVGVSMEKSKTLVNKIITMNSAEPVGTAYMPSIIMYDNETLFPQYQITSTKNGEKIKFDVSCY